jgi:hypothetical protein
MTTSKLLIGATPWDEACAQVGTEGYRDRAVKECRAFLKQLERHYTAEIGGELPCRLVIEAHPHDFGSYHEVSAVFADDSKEAVEAAYWLEAHSPEKWDSDSRAELGIVSEPE